MKFLDTTSKTFIMILFLSLLFSGVILMYSVITGFDEHVQTLHVGIEEVAKNVSETAKELVENVEPVQHVVDTISQSEPLVVTDTASDTDLTVHGIYGYTNNERNDEGLEPFLIQDALNIVAEARLDDMFEKQYFAHYSPSGVGAADIAKQFGYDFIAIGENIAMGNFGDDAGVVQAWMDSPGHRANILKPSYTKIGVAAAKGVILGQETWVAVQIFATPADACPKPDFETPEQIKLLEAKVQSNQAKTQNILDTVEGRAPTTGEDLDYYNAQIQQYNDLVKVINADIESMKKLASEYNGTVKAYNKCIQGL